MNTEPCMWRSVQVSRPVEGVQLVVPLLTLSREEVEALENNSASAPRIIAWDCPEDEDAVDPFNNLSDSEGEWEHFMFENVREVVGFNVVGFLDTPVRTETEVTQLLVGVPDLEGTCNICLDALTVTAVETKCGHHYHLPCVSPWLKTHNTCPVCRSVLVRHDDMESILVSTQ